MKYASLYVPVDHRNCLSNVRQNDFHPVWRYKPLIATLIGVRSCETCRNDVTYGLACAGGYAFHRETARRQRGPQL